MSGNEIVVDRRVRGGEKVDVARLDSSVGNLGCEAKERECRFLQ